MNKIPFVDLELQYTNIKEEVLAKVEEVLDSKAFIQGKYVEEFEQTFAKMHQSPYAVGCSNGTTAIALALEALGVGRGDEVITSTHTFIATAEAICHVGARPVFVDINPETYCIDPNLVEAAITEKTKAIIPVHIYGNPCDMQALKQIAEKHQLFLIEDSAQAHLATYSGKTIGSLSDMATFSFYPGKNLGAYGDAGAVICQKPEHDGLLRKLRDHGRVSKYTHDIVGYNYRMDGIQAAILSIKLKYLPEWTELRKQHAAVYDEFFKKLGIKVIEKTPNSSPVYHLYIIETDSRDELMEHLKANNISCGIHYPIPLHLQPAFTYLEYKEGSMPHAETACRRMLSIPIYPELSDEQITNICNTVGNFLSCSIKKLA